MSSDPAGRRLSRRSFLKTGAVLAASATGLISCDGLKSGEGKRLAGGIAGASRKIGHMLTGDGSLPPVETERSGIVIVGGGIAGLSAARELRRRGFSDFLLLELEGKTGGNSTSGSNACSRYPWGAHYVPIPGEQAVFVRELFEELEIIKGYDRKGLPIYNEFHLCADPQERLFMHGKWQEGLLPQTGISANDRRQYDEFFRSMERFREARGRDGRKAFAIPVDYSSADAGFVKYDAVSMARFMADNGWDSKHLLWYVNYCCRDDYGCRMEDVSAWAGLHYFAGRSGRASNAEPHAVVTWPEGNGWIVDRLAKTMHPHIRPNACVLNIESRGNDLALDYHDVCRSVIVRIIAKAVIYAAPRFTAFKTIRDFRERPPSYTGKFGYAPWMVANITVSGAPGGKGAPLAWDNVSYYSSSLGYVVANHQDLATHREKTVLTYYYPLTSGSPEEERKKALDLSHNDWTRLILNDLSAVHPDIGGRIEELNVWLWGHAMVRPVPGFIWGKARQEALRPHGKIHFANSDMSGISIFEEAQYRGIMASRSVLRQVFKNT